MGFFLQLALFQFLAFPWVMLNKVKELQTVFSAEHISGIINKYIGEYIDGLSTSLYRFYDIEYNDAKEKLMNRFIDIQDFFVQRNEFINELVLIYSLS